MNKHHYDTETQNIHLFLFPYLQALISQKNSLYLWLMNKRNSKNVLWV